MNTQKTYLIANINLYPRLEVVKDLFKVPCPGSTQVTGITVRLEEYKESKREETTDKYANYKTVTEAHRRAKAHLNVKMLLYQVELCHCFSDIREIS